MKPGLEDTALAPSPSPQTTATLAKPRPAVAPAGLREGEQLGHFRIGRRLGAGGMGEVYLATDLALDRPVAIKVLPEDVANDPKRRERMIREARAQARVSHPNVGHIYFIGEEADRLYFAMEYVNGKTLGEVIAQGPLSVDDALSIVRAAASGLREANREGFTHRDVKPSNLMLDHHDMVKVLDFGLAADGGGAVTEGPVAQTSLAGTPLYMAPEQARGEAVDQRADIYALGATLYHLISGKPPFQADSVDELLSMHATSVRPTVPRRGIPRTQIGAIDALIARMMAAKPEDRFADYDELLRAIELASNAQTRPAGFWVRSIATFIDFVVVLIPTALVFSLIGLFTDQAFHDDAIQFTLFVLYDTFTTARWGRTLGKAIFELEIVDVVTARRPSLPRSARRALAMLGLPALVMWINVPLDFFEASIRSWFVGGFMMVYCGLAFLALVHAAARVSGKRTPWDRIAGTMVRYRTTRTAAK